MSRQDVLKSVMHKCFMCMLSNDMLSSQAWAEILNGFLSVLEIGRSITDKDKEFCIICFMQEYNLGCNNKMTQDYITNVVTPAIMKMELSRRGVVIGTDIYNRVNETLTASEQQILG